MVKSQYNCIMLPFEDSYTVEYKYNTCSHIFVRFNDTNQRRIIWRGKIIVAFTFLMKHVCLGDSLLTINVVVVEC